MDAARQSATEVADAHAAGCVIQHPDYQLLPLLAALYSQRNPMNAPVAVQTAHLPAHIARSETSAVAVAAQAKALVEARYVMAMQYPRDMDMVRAALLKECKRPGFAATARYVKPVGKDRNKWPAGPSIRFAETAVRCMRNITVETITVYDDNEKRIVRVTVADLEANVPYSQDVSITKTIERRSVKDGDVVLKTRANSYGDTVYILEATDDDILNKQAALISKSIRTLGLRLVPGDIVEECMFQVLETQRTTDAEDPDAAKRRLFDSFGAIGVTVEQLKEYLGHDAATLAAKEMSELRSLFSAIRDGEATWREVMDGKDGKGDKPKTPPAPKELPTYTAEEFAAKLVEWAGLIKDGKRTADEIAAKIGAKYNLSDDQKAQIQKLGQPA